MEGAPKFNSHNETLHGSQSEQFSDTEREVSPGDLTPEQQVDLRATLGQIDAPNVHPQKKS
jgi:hypothetical protein